MAAAALPMPGRSAALFGRSGRRQAGQTRCMRLPAFRLFWSLHLRVRHLPWPAPALFTWLMAWGLALWLRQQLPALGLAGAFVPASTLGVLVQISLRTFQRLLNEKKLEVPRGLIFPEQQQAILKASGWLLGPNLHETGQNGAK